MSLINKATAGSVESGDIMLMIEPNNNNTIEIELQSTVIKQYGSEIKDIITKELLNAQITSAKIIATDQGALPAVIKARTITVIRRALNSQDL